MKSHVSVLLRPGPRSIREALDQTLERFRLREDDLDSIRSHHYDYWVFPEQDPLADADFARDFPAEEEELREHACYVRHLPGDYVSSAFIVEDGEWTDLQDFGWKMMREPSPDNAHAQALWRQRASEILADLQDWICVRIMIHN